MVHSAAMSTKPVPLPDDYPELLEQLNERISAARIRAALNVNRELVLLAGRVNCPTACWTNPLGP
jgi:hypothetical protein